MFIMFLRISYYYRNKAIIIEIKRLAVTRLVVDWGAVKMLVLVTKAAIYI